MRKRWRWRKRIGLDSSIYGVLIIELKTSTIIVVVIWATTCVFVYPHLDRRYYSLFSQRIHSSLALLLVRRLCQPTTRRCITDAATQRRQSRMMVVLLCRYEHLRALRLRCDDVFQAGSQRRGPKTKCRWWARY
ncbi:unnamed protein product [Ectocarpus sp. 12 AP-2014]